MDATDQSKWCPSCGDEYHARVDRCVDCRVDLISHRPVELVPVDGPTGGALEVPSDRPEAFDISDLDDDQFDRLMELLDRDSLPRQWVDAEVVMVPAGYGEDMARRLEQVRGSPAFVPLLAGHLASLRQRAIAWLIDDGILVAGIAVSRVLGAPLGIVIVVALGISAFGHVVGLGERGRSVGKLLASVRVRKRAGGRLGAGEAATRILVRDAFIGSVWIAILVSDPISVSLPLAVAACGFAAIVGTVVVGDHHRGIHDLIVDSAVYRGPVEADDGVIRGPEIIS